MKKIKKPTLRDRLPGDPTKEQLIERFIRVDQAGEYGAVRIYEGQLRVLGATATAPVIRRIAEQEQQHLETFNDLIGKRSWTPARRN